MRQPTLCERKRNGKTTYYCQIDGKQHGLGTDRAQAEIEFGKRLAREEVKTEVEEKGVNSLTVRKLIVSFLDWIKEHRAAGTYLFYAQSLIGTAKESQGFVPFADTVGELTVADFGIGHVEDWLARYADKSSTYRHNLARAVVAACNWALKRKVIKENPLAGLEKPQQEARKAYITDEQWSAIMAVVDGNFRDFLEFLKESGARPMEARVATAANFDREGRRLYWETPVKKVRGKSQPRIVLLNDKAFALCEKLALKNQDGPLFLNDDATPWLKNTLTARCARLKKKLGFGFSVYALRHKFCTAALMNGVGPLEVAILLGHKDATQVMRTYSKLSQCHDHLRAALLKATA